jgi:Mrp family chromosome partitioning ATPase
LGKLIAELEDQCDYLIFDSPPVLSVSDAAIIASHVDGTLLVAHGGSTVRSAVVHAREELERVGADIIGAVLNAFKPAGRPYGTYYRYSSSGEYSKGKHTRPGSEVPRYVARG